MPALKVREGMPFGRINRSGTANRVCSSPGRQAFFYYLAESRVPYLWTWTKGLLIALWNPSCPQGRMMTLLTHNKKEKSSNEEDDFR